MGTTVRHGRRPYAKPTVRRIKIVADELAVTGCKTRLAVRGPNPGGCFRSNCRTVGS